MKFGSSSTGNQIDKDCDSLRTFKPGVNGIEFLQTKEESDIIGLHKLSKVPRNNSQFWTTNDLEDSKLKLKEEVRESIKYKGSNS